MQTPVNCHTKSRLPHQIASESGCDSDRPRAQQMLVLKQTLNHHPFEQADDFLLKQKSPNCPTRHVGQSHSFYAAVSKSPAISPHLAPCLISICPNELVSGHLNLQSGI
ncbi:unnamed protein product [Protopolystoma xenopodis]|uniref:Uncharacterized protein n=1 Tax=Protopolystoma xenopodis TaxID=117903 RepID=A0A448WP65_9PLAT|nr:unnamed protein product [Protopolystoma xenopodis]